MSTTILPVRTPNLPLISPLPSVKAEGPAHSSFSDLISSSIGVTERAQGIAANAAQAFLSGQNEDLHTVAIAEQKAEITSELFLQLRNKAISAYQEIMKMQL